MLWWLIVHIVLLIAAARVTRLVTTDTITNDMRLWVDKIATPADHHTPVAMWRIMLTELVHCPWCIGFWISAAAAAIAEIHTPTAPLPPWLAIPAVAFAYSQLVGLAANHWDKG